MLHVLHMIDSLCIGGAEKLLVTFARAARERQIQVTVVSLRHADQTPIPDDLVQHGANVQLFHATKLMDGKRTWRLSRFLRQQSIDVIQTHLTYANILGALTGRLAQRPVVATLHNTVSSQTGYKPMRYQLETWALRHGSHHVIAVGEAVAQAHRNRIRQTPLSVVPNAINPPPTLSDQTRIAIRQRLIGDPSRTLIISVGSLTPQKAFTDLLDAFARLRQSHPSAVLVIAGGGPLRNEIETHLRQLNLEGDALLLGPRDDVPQLLAASDVYVNSSHWEGLPVSILEAMAAGLPIVATGVGDVPHIVTPDHGITVPPRQPEALVEALKILCDAPAHRTACGLAAKAHVAQHYDANVWVDHLLAVYKDAQASAYR